MIICEFFLKDLGVKHVFRCKFQKHRLSLYQVKEVAEYVVEVSLFLQGLGFIKSWKFMTLRTFLGCHLSATE